ncbi:MAG TPA: formate dehydrogenase subunit alpha [Nitrospirota bacterium]
MPELIIDGRPVSVDADTTVLQAARKLGIYIPTLCYDERLKNSGACRMCIVEAEGSSRMIASCCTPVRDGWNLKTASPKVHEARKTLVELLLASHADCGGVCADCARTGRCELQTWAYAYDLCEPAGKPDCASCESQACKTVCQKHSIVKKGKKVSIDYDKCDNCRQCAMVCRYGVLKWDGEKMVMRGMPASKKKVNRFEGERHEYEPVSSPFIVRDNNKCIMCGKCVRICQEIEGRSILTFTERGFESTVSTAFERPLEEVACSFCGHCVSVCPTGALVEKNIAEQAGDFRDDELEKTETVCPYCGVGCVLQIQHKDGNVYRVTANVGRGSNNGSLCVKGRFGYEFVNSPDRLTKPLIRVNGKRAAKGQFREASWSEVIKLIARKFKAARKADPDSFAALSSARCSNEENYMLQKFTRLVMGTNNIDHCARLCHASTVTGLVKAFGSGAMTGSMSDFDNADTFFVIGSNTTESHPVIGLRIRKTVREGRAKLIVADPRKIEMAEMADVWLRQRPGTDVALLNGLMNVIISEQHEKNRKFIDERTENYGELYAAVKDFTPEKAAGITGVPAEEIRKAAKLIVNGKAVCFIYSMGITQHTTGVDNVLSVANIAMLTGNIGRPGTGVYPLRGQNNVQGACDVGALPDVYPGYQRVADESTRRKFEKVWGGPLPAKPGLTVNEIIDACGHGDITTLMIMGENPVLSDPDSNHVKKALKKLDFLVVQDIFLTETGQLADVILPALSWAEKDGTFTNTERRVQLGRAALAPIGKARTDWEIIALIAGAMGSDKFNFNTARNIFREMATLTPQYVGINYGRLEETCGIQWPCPTKDHPGTPTLHTEKFTRGRGKFHAVQYRPPAEKTDREYPFVLTTGRILQHYHTGTMTRRVEGLNHLVPEAFVEINPKDAARLKVSTGDFLKVASRRGEIKIKAKVTERVAKGEVFIPFHFVEASANMLTAANLDPVAKIPEFKVSAVSMSKA